MNIVGVSAFYHESTCCLIQDGRLVAAVPEERFTRVKYDRRVPINAFRYCLEAGGHLSPGDIDCIAYYEDPEKKLSRQKAMGLADHDDKDKPERDLRDAFGVDCPFMHFDHHLSHGAGSFYFSGFSEAAVFTVDGVGEWATTIYGAGQSKDEDFIIDKESVPNFLRKTAQLAPEPFRNRVEGDLHPLLSGNLERWRPAEEVLPEGVYTFV
ncbi:MAG: hypothetical protein H7318_05030 [Oligoflexus sp.]|nr:hypothetical protein [Oligoflexus sp.]